MILKHGEREIMLKNAPILLTQPTHIFVSGRGHRDVCVGPIVGS